MNKPAGKIEADNARLRQALTDVRNALATGNWSLAWGHIELALKEKEAA